MGKEMTAMDNACDGIADNDSEEENDVFIGI